ncbi:MAG TPA: serine/threonine-protein kinase [Gemmatimonadaceae bacterium]
MPVQSPDVSPEFFALQRAVAGRYSLVRELGRGGMGVVFLARDVALDRPVAIKMLPPPVAFSREHRDRFLLEARTAARLSHPHIVPIHAVEEIGDVVIIVMGFVDGETLGALIARTGTLPPAEANRIAREVAWALAHAHANGVVHRDIKPDNILIEAVSRRAVVTDFGIARGLNADTTGSGRIVGTPRFMSPEQGAGDHVDGRSDLYSLGVVAFYATVGRVPFDGTSAASILVRHLNEPVPSVLEGNPRVPVPLATVIERCLAKNPADRFASADELALSLQAAEPSGSDVAPPVREFLRANETLGVEIGTSIATAVWCTVLILILRVKHPTEGGDAFGAAIRGAIALALYTGAGVAMLGLGGLRLNQLVQEIRRLLRAGYRYPAVRLALRSDLEHRPPGPSPRSSTLSVLGHVVLPLIGTWVARDGPGYWPLLGAAVAIALPTMTLSNRWNTGRWWQRAMASRLGSALFKLAGLRLGSVRETPADGEPTIVAIGNAAGALFTALPEHVQRRYPELPVLIGRLEERATAVRDDPVLFSSSVTALETLRLHLLRLHTAVTPAKGLTEDVDSVNRIGDEIAAHVAALDELARLPTSDSPEPA